MLVVDAKRHERRGDEMIRDDFRRIGDAPAPIVAEFAGEFHIEAGRAGIADIGG
jgi:hypothetical protein